MRITCFAALAACVVHVVFADKCVSNSCLRAVKKIATGERDCRSFLSAVTVSPPARTQTTTTTTTITVTATSTLQNHTNSQNSSTASSKIASTASRKPHEPRDFEYEPSFDSLGEIQPLEERKLTPTSKTKTSLPTYARPCSSIAAYSSACSCLGVSPVTTTAVAKTTTRTLTVTKTVANMTIVANHTSSLGNSTSGQGWNATSSRSISLTSQSSEQETSSSSSTVHVLKTTTLITTTTPWVNTSSIAAQSLASNSSTARFWNSSSIPATIIANTTAPAKLNISTASSSSLGNNSTARWHNTSTAVTLLANSTRPVWLNTSTPIVGANITTGHWLNTTRLSPLPTNTTGFRWPNSTMLPNATSVRWLNSSSSVPTPTATMDTTCGETTTPFALQVSQPDGMFDGWFVRASGNGLLFTSARSSASSFSVEATGHLCAVGHLDSDDRPYIAAVGILDPSSDVWLLRSGTLRELDEDYAAVSCTKDGALSCAANATNGASHWLGCGLQLDLSSDGGGTVPVRGLNCTSLGLNVIDANQ